MIAYYTNHQTEHPKSENTLKRNKYSFGTTKYKNDIGKPCLYRVIRDGVDTLERVQYYGGRLLQVMSVKKPV